MGEGAAELAGHEPKGTSAPAAEEGGRGEDPSGENACKDEKGDGDCACFSSSRRDGNVTSTLALRRLATIVRRSGVEPEPPVVGERAEKECGERGLEEGGGEGDNTARSRAAACSGGG